MLLDAGDRDSLVALFSNRMLSHYHFSEIEFLLVVDGKHINDPVLILFDAYERSQIAGTRSNLAQAIRRSSKAQASAETMTRTSFARREWYMQNKTNLALNIRYGGHGSFDDDYINNPLFVSRVPTPKKSLAERRSKEPNASDQPLKRTVNSTGMKMILIPAGEFEMGSPDDELGRDERQELLHPVRITRPFWLGVFEVTQAEYETVMGTNPSCFSAGGSLGVTIDGAGHPAIPC